MILRRSPDHQRVSRGRQRRPDASAFGSSPPKSSGGAAVEKAVVFRRASDKNGGGGGEQSNTKSYNIQQVISNPEWLPTDMTRGQLRSGS